MILESYLGAFANACKSAGGWYGLDLFAGPGLNWSKTRNKERNGSPIIALETESPMATQIIAAESYKRSYDALHQRTERYDDRIQLFKLDRQITKSSGQPMYFLIFATDHDAGERIMDHCFDQVRIRVQEELGQAQLFSVKEAPRRKRLGEH